MQRIGLGVSVMVRKAERERQTAHQDEADGPSCIQIEPTTDNTMTYSSATLSVLIGDMSGGRTPISVYFELISPPSGRQSKFALERPAEGLLRFVPNGVR